MAERWTSIYVYPKVVGSTPIGTCEIKLTSVELAVLLSISCLINWFLLLGSAPVKVSVIRNST